MDTPDQWERPRTVILVPNSEPRALQASYPGEHATAVGALRAFLMLETATDEQVVAFVRRYGQLGLGWRSERVHARASGDQERVQDYRDYARLLAATRSVAQSVTAGATPDATALEAVRTFQVLGRRIVGVTDLFADRDARTVISNFPAPTHVPGAVGLAHWRGLQARRVTSVVSWWLGADDLGPRLVWGPSNQGVGAPTIQHAGSLWGALGLQLLRMIVEGGEASETRCAGCDRSLGSRQRRPKNGQAAWCKRPSCVRTRDRVRKQRAREHR